MFMSPFVFASRFAASVWYYVISFAITDFFGSKYVNLAVAGAIDILITIICMYIVKRCVFIS